MKRRLFRMVFGLAVFLTGCVPTYVPRVPSFRPSGTFAAALLSLSITDVQTGEKITSQELHALSLRLQSKTNTLLRQKDVHLISIEKCTEHLKATDFDDSVDSVLRGVVNPEQFAPSDAFTCLDSSGIDFLLVTEIKARVGLRSGGPGILPFWGPGGPGLYFGGPHPRDPSAVLLSAKIIDLKRRKVAWENQVFRRENINSEAALVSLLAELFDPVE